MSASSTPLPLLPLEVKGHILRFCDVRTLGRASQVSLAMLEMSGPLLYRDVTIRGRAQLEKLIRSETVLDSIAPYVTLAQTSTFTYVLLGNSSAAHDLSQALSSSAVAVERCTVDLRELGSDQSNSPCVDLLLSSFNPCELHVLSAPTALGPIGRCVYARESFKEWMRLRQLTLTDTHNFHFLANTPGFAHRHPLLDIVYNLTSSEEDQGPPGDLDDVCRIVGADLRTKEPTLKSFGRVQVWLHNEEEVAIAKTVLIGLSCTSLEIAVKQPTAGV